MLCELEALAASAEKTNLTCDVIVVGAGLAGLTLADYLIEGGLSVIVLESGSSTSIDDANELNIVEQIGQFYSGAIDGRFRGLGGTSNKWGGALLPYLDSDFDAHPCGWHEGLEVDPERMFQALRRIERAFGVDTEKYLGRGAEVDVMQSFMPRSPKWPRFKSRSAAHIFSDRIKNDGSLKVVTGATVTKIETSRGNVSGVLASSTSGKTIKVNSSKLALTAGAIETTRLLLILKMQCGSQGWPANSPLGVGFHDHLSAPVADLLPTDRTKIAERFGFEFVRGGMRNLRFELKREVRAQEKLPAAFLHVGFAREPGGGFESLRSIYQAIQSGSSVTPKDVCGVIRDFPWFLSAAWWRFIKRRVLPPFNSRYELHLVTEQMPYCCNVVDLSPTRVDRFGLPLARVKWAIHDADKEYFWRIAERACSEWENSDLSRVAVPSLYDRSQVELKLHECGGIFHPAGTTRMGRTSDEGVVDSRLRVFGIDGLWSIATSIFPSIGGTSPSLGLMQLAIVAGDDIVSSLKASGVSSS